MTRTTRTLAAALAASTALFVSACSGDSEANTEAACAALTEYQTALDDLAGSLSGSATVEQLRDARDDVAASAERLDEAVGDVEQDRVDALESAWKGLEDTIEGLDDDASLQSAVETVRAEAQKVQTARADLSTAIDCR